MLQPTLNVGTDLRHRLTELQAEATDGAVQPAQPTDRRPDAIGIIPGVERCDGAVNGVDQVVETGYNNGILVGDWVDDPADYL